ncbi:response regulator [Methylopila sp. M107]|uniref:response regulator n=1 Tax=Methylopila sp. M107 TaxID=1101190 RepID=UPI00035E236E|nr:response regulator [Methylopila sp. M107]
MTDAQTTSDGLAGLRILLVEDEAMIAMLVEDMLTDSGATVVGPASGVKAALDAISNHEIDGALLDVNLGGERSFEVADALASRNIPFVFVTGYGGGDVSDRFPDAPTLQKPFVTSDLERALSGLAGAARGQSTA